MPIYEYRCQQCGQHFEKLVRTIDEQPEDLACPQCESPDVQRLISRVAVASSPSATPGEGAGEPAARPPVFGRKERNEALKERGY